MKLSLVLVAGLVCVTSVFGRICVVGETTSGAKAHMPKELHGLYYNSNSKKNSKKEMCSKQTEDDWVDIIDCGISLPQGEDCFANKVVSTTNHDYKITLNCVDVEGGSGDVTKSYKKVNEDIVVTEKLNKKSVSSIYKPCK